MTYSIQSLLDNLRATILGDNFTIKCFSFKPTTPTADLVENKAAIVLELIKKAHDFAWPEAFVEQIKKSYLDRYSSSMISTHAFALNLFRMAEDNWFSYARAEEACAWFKEVEYLKDLRELFLLKNIDSRLLLPGLAVAPDVALVIDKGEDTVHLMVIGLAD